MKPKVLILAINDSTADGQGYRDFLHFPDYFEKRIVVENSNVDENVKSFHNISSQRKSLKSSFLYRYYLLRYRLYSLLHFGGIAVPDEEKNYYSFFGREWVPYTADEILEKIGDFKPDIISVYWTSRFITSKTLHDLHVKTGALINLHFVDEAHMTGGCHYPSDCDGYTSHCQNCPALKFGKKVAHYQLEYKIKNLSNVPICITGTPADIDLAKKSALFKDVNFFIPWVVIPEVIKCDKTECRKKYNLKSDDFTVLIGATNFKSKRKGSKYSMEAIRMAASKIPHINLVCIGKESIKESLPENVNITQLGFLEKQEYYEVMTASDCFLSTSIADSGPMMVNHAITVGTPVVSFNIGIARTLVQHKRTGYLAEYMNSESVSQGICFIQQKLHSDKYFFSVNCEELVQNLSRQKDAFECLYEIYVQYNKR